MKPKRHETCSCEGCEKVRELYENPEAPSFDAEIPIVMQDGYEDVMVMKDIRGHLHLYGWMLCKEMQPIGVVIAPM